MNEFVGSKSGECEYHKKISDIPWHTNNENELIIPYFLDSPQNKQERNAITCKDISSRFIIILITYSCL